MYKFKDSFKYFVLLYLDIEALDFVETLGEQIFENMGGDEDEDNNDQGKIANDPNNVVGSVYVTIS